MEETTKLKTKKHAKRVLDQGSKLLMLVIPALVSYLAARTQAHDEARAQAHTQSQQVESKAEAGYLETAMAVKHLDEEASTVRIYIGKLEARIEMLEKKVSRLRGDRNPPEAGVRMTDVAPEPEPLDMPANLDTAAEKHGQ